MAGAILKPQKRVLGDATKNHSNILLSSPASAKKRKLESDQPSVSIKSSSQNAARKPTAPGLNQSQQKSQFVEEVLEKLSQDISGLKQTNAEKDQQWERPPLGDFDEQMDSLCFQQIEAEEGTLVGGKTAVKLFGVTEVIFFVPLTWALFLLTRSCQLDWSFCSLARYRFLALLIRCGPRVFRPK